MKLLYVVFMCTRTSPNTIINKYWMINKMALSRGRWIWPIDLYMSETFRPKYRHTFDTKIELLLFFRETTWIDLSFQELKLPFCSSKFFLWLILNILQQCRALTALASFFFFRTMAPPMTWWIPLPIESSNKKNKFEKKT